MKEAARILHDIPGTLQAQLVAVLLREREQVFLQMLGAQGLQAVGRAQGKLEVVNALLSGLGRATSGYAQQQQQEPQHAGISTTARTTATS